ncbi:hypothetical protein PUR34_02035 [Streptomyces sp. JV185]|uniref:hypothetical protein n=1 Tax=Streptomyces sp. JV185 TaxID=858638 RepID=UPI002E7AACDF|nr:hypothetical protein [Streptomyces sp. JV185]MEE1767015.1 hypothetical protein [Streptomyces sp. JV185]
MKRGPRGAQRLGENITTRQQQSAPPNAYGVQLLGVPLAAGAQVGSGRHATVRCTPQGRPGLTSAEGWVTSGSVPA